MLTGTSAIVGDTFQSYHIIDYRCTCVRPTNNFNLKMMPRNINALGKNGAVWRRYDNQQAEWLQMSLKV